MANEICINLTLQYEDDEDTEEGLQVNNFYADLTSFQFTKAKQSIGTSEEAIQLGGVTSPRWLMAINRDDTNYVEIKTGTGGTIVARLYPGAPMLIPLGSGMQAPYAISNTAACLLEYFVGNAT